MTLTEFEQSITKNQMPNNLLPCLQALWLEANGNWDKAHQIIQHLWGTNPAWVHAYLHRKEPDEWNANYWYSQAGKKNPNISFRQEWKNITQTLLMQ